MFGGASGWPLAHSSGLPSTTRYVSRIRAAPLNAKKRPTSITEVGRFSLCSGLLDLPACAETRSPVGVVAHLLDRNRRADRRDLRRLTGDLLGL